MIVPIVVVTVFVASLIGWVLGALFMSVKVADLIAENGDLVAENQQLRAFLNSTFDEVDAALDTVGGAR